MMHRTRNLSVLVFVFFLATFARATNLQGNVMDPSGSSFSGYLIFTLSSPTGRAVQRISTNTTIFNKRPIRFNVTNGALPTNSFIIGNDDIRPSGTFYEVQFYNTVNVLIAAQFWDITGNTYDVGNPTVVNPPKFVQLYKWPTSTAADIASVASPPATLTSIQITPSQPQISLTQHVQLNLLAFYNDSSGQVVTNNATWSSSNTAVATINTSGYVTSVGEGSTNITASYTSNSVTLTTSISLVVSSATLSSVSISPSSPILALSTTLQLTANGLYKDGSTQDLTDSVTWTTANSTVATVNSTGLLTGISQGTTSVSASFGATIATATVAVTPPVPSSLVMSPSSATIQPGQQEQFAAIGVYSDGTEHDLSANAIWRSGSTNIASVNSSGVATGVSSGTTTITASITTSGNVLSQSAILNVVAVSKVFTSATANWLYSAAKGTTTPVPSGLQFSLLTNDGGNSYPVDTTDGGNGCTTFTDTLIHPYGDVVCVPNPPVGSAGFTPASTSGHLIVFNTATNNYYDFWRLSVDATGTPTSTNVGQIVTGNVTTSDGAPGATGSGLTGYAGVITSDDLACSTCLNHAIEAVVPSNLLNSNICNQAPATVSPGASPAGMLCAGGKIMLDSTFNFSGLSLSPAVSAIFRALQLYGAVVVDQQNVSTISFYTDIASQPNTTGLSSLDGHLLSYQFLPAGQSLIVTPSSPTVLVGSQVNEKAVFTLTNGSQQTVTSQAVWASSAPSVATVNTNGVITGIAVGSAQISAVYNGLVADISVSVAPNSGGGGGGGTASLAVTPSNPSIAVGSTQNETATYTNTSNQNSNVTSTATWSSNNTSVATVNNSGLVTGVAAGSATISAAYSGLTAQTTVTVTSSGGGGGGGSSGAGGVYGTAGCPGCFFSSAASMWIYGPSAPGVATHTVSINGGTWTVPVVWGTPKNVSNSLSSSTFSLHTNNGDFANPIEHYNSSSLGSNPKTWYFHGNDDSMSVTLPSNFQFTPSCSWQPPSTFGATSCYGAFDGHLVIIDDATGNFYFFGQLIVSSNGQPSCGTSAGSPCNIRSAGTGNLATSDPSNCTPLYDCGDSNTGTNNALGDIIPSGTPTNTGTPVQTGELDCFTCLNHGINFVYNDNNNKPCNAFPVPRFSHGDNPDGNDSNGRLGEGGVIFFTGNWQSWENDGVHSTAVVAIARALQLYGGYDTDSSGGVGIGVYTDYNSSPSMAGSSDIIAHLAFFGGSSSCTP